MKIFGYIVLVLCMFVTGVAFAAEQIYVRSNASLAEIVPEEPLIINTTIKQKLNNGAPTHAELGVKYLTKQIAKAILGVTSSEAESVIEALMEDGLIMTYEDRYSELYPSEETP